MFAAKEIKTRPAPLDCVLVNEFKGQRFAQNNVYEVLGRRAAVLFHEYASVNTDEDFKKRRALQFRAIAGFHPQEVLDAIDRITAPSRAANP